MIETSFRIFGLNRPSSFRCCAPSLYQVAAGVGYCDWRHGRGGCGGRHQLEALTATETDDSAFLLATPSAPPVGLPARHCEALGSPLSRRAGPGPLSRRLVARHRERTNELADVLQNGRRRRRRR